MEFLKLSYIDFDTYFFIFFPGKGAKPSPAASYVLRLAVCSNLPANVYVSVKQVKVVERS